MTVLEEEKDDMNRLKQSKFKIQVIPTTYNVFCIQREECLEMIRSEIFRKIQNYSAKRTKIQYIQDFEIHTRFIKSTNNIFSILNKKF